MASNHTTYYDPKQPVTVQVDDSSKALEAALIHNNKVAAYASKSLTKTEQQYANLEREMLACISARKDSIHTSTVERFHTYIYG